MIDVEFIVPPGWVQIPTTPDTARVRRKVIDELIRYYVPDSLPRDKAGPVRKMLRKELIEATDEAARQNARSVLMPLEEYSGMRLPGSMLVAVVENENEDEAEDPERLLASILADAGDAGTYLEIGGAPAVRVAEVIDNGRIKRAAPSWRVSYYVSNPDVPGVWGLLTFTVLTDGDVDAEPVQAVMLLFDAVVSTMRWEDRVDVPTEDELLAQVDELSKAVTVASGADMKDS
jgi:hypothetical protein